ncbi:hypothetical protein B0H14DRAFT_3744031 [Mycena olivaceomarginata]|nr:hypothetical protein B0H14DRAFT_3744031 [Mycena olivaceomarginata]
MDDTTSPSFIWGLFVRELFETSATFIFYGANVLAESQCAYPPAGLYVNLFIIAMYTLRHRRTSGRTWLLGASWMLFVVGTLQTILRISILTLVARAVALLVGRSRSEVPTAEIVGLLQKRLDLALAGNAVFAVNGVEIEFSAGRIWWVRMALENVPDLHSSINTVYSAAISIILESGSIYCFSAFLLAIALTTAGSSSELYSVLLGIAYQAINIAPTLTVVRVGLGHNIEDAVKTGFTQPPNPMRTM